ncbi:hypothetical protein ACFLZZ_00755 [Nanoarchaeota archaeon]
MEKSKLVVIVNRGFPVLNVQENVVKKMGYSVKTCKNSKEVKEMLEEYNAGELRIGAFIIDEGFTTESLRGNGAITSTELIGKIRDLDDTVPIRYKPREWDSKYEKMFEGKCLDFYKGKSEKLSTVDHLKEYLPKKFPLR